MDSQLELEFGPEAILNLMRITKKAEPLFKVLKKLKAALEVPYRIILRQSSTKTCRKRQPRT